jgi:hypothetical protein
MKATFIGDADGDGPELFEIFGHFFTKGEPVDVSGMSEFCQNKLRNNGHFRTEESGESVDIDHIERTTLVAEALEVYGEKIHHRTGLEKVRKIVDDLRAKGFPASEAADGNDQE